MASQSVQAMYTNARSLVRVNGTFSDEFNVNVWFSSWFGFESIAS